MTRHVDCRKYNERLPGLTAPPFPGPVGAAIFETVSQRAWDEWTALQTRLINEKHLRMTDPAARKFLAEQREKFFANASDVEEASGYVEPNKDGS